jgi:alpha-1,6-mannosyltransferase
MRRLTFCDISTFYCPTGGGVRTYYDAKLDWFRRQSRHRYILIIPGKRSSRRALTPSVTLVEARGIGVTRSREGYRIFLDFAHIRSMVRECRPDVLEAGDPWISGPLALCHAGWRVRYRTSRAAPSTGFRRRTT